MIDIPNLGKAEKNFHLGQTGVGALQLVLIEQGIATAQPWDTFDPAVDLIVYPNFPDKTGYKTAQIKTKSPWVYEKAQSFTKNQWYTYKSQVDLIFLICAPAPIQYVEKDSWAGHLYMIDTKTVQVREKTTKDGREMVLIDLNNHEPLHKFKKDGNILKRMSELITEDT